MSQSFINTCYNNYVILVEESSHHLLELTGSVDTSPVKQNNCSKIPASRENKTKTKTAQPSGICISASETNLNSHLTQQQQQLKKQSMTKQAREIEKVQNTIIQGYKIMIILRGLPGSGKSTLAKSILSSSITQALPSDHIFSTDDYFMSNNTYNYNVHKIGDAHGWNHNRVFKAVCKGVSPIIIDNTNKQMWEMKPYANMAIDGGYYLEILEPDTWWAFNAKELARRNTHNVPKDKIKDLIDRYEKNISGYKLLCAYNFHYSPKNKPPQFRNFPPLMYAGNSFTSYNKNNASNPELATTLNALVSQQQPIQEVSESFNLMEFNDTVEISDDEDDTNLNSNKPPNIVDEILMCPLASDPIILKPNFNKNPFFDMQNAWGVDEKALQSWDIVTPLRYERDDLNEATTHDEDSPVAVPTETKDFSTNTDYNDFMLVTCQFVPEGVTVLPARNRDINANTTGRNSSGFAGVMKKLKLDKSCLTEDEYFENDSFIDAMERLVALFPKIPKSYLKEIYVRCGNQLAWTIEVLLEDNSVINEDITEVIEEIQDEDSEHESLHTHYLRSCDKAPSVTATPEKANKRKLKGSITKEANILKQALENNISPAPYTPGRSKYPRKNNLDKQFVPSTSKSESFMTSAGEIIVLDSDLDFEECDFDSVNFSDKGEVINRNEMVELNLGEDLVNQLEEKFGDSNMGYPKGFQPVVQVPVDLARQLHALYVESVYQQMDAQDEVYKNLLQQDEEFAKKLHEQENQDIEKMSQAQVPNLSEIIKDQKALSAHQRENDSWKNFTPDNLAALLTRKKLYSIFPDINKDTLVEILQAHDNSYNQTLEVLLASTNRVIAQGEEIDKPPLTEELIDEMKRDQELPDETDMEERRSAIYYREEADKCLRKRNELYEKARLYHQRGMTEVATFYSQLAFKQTQLFDRANNMAATSFIQEHSDRLKDFDRLDLHYLYVKEALPALDLFIDRNINLLRGPSVTTLNQNLFIITGRGKHSADGIPKLKTAVIIRLKKRGIKFGMINEGLLRIKIDRHSKMTDELKD